MRRIIAIPVFSFLALSGLVFATQRLTEPGVAAPRAYAAPAAPVATATPAAPEPTSGVASSAMAPSSEAEARKRYLWPRRRAGYESLATRFPAPQGFQRVAVTEGSYAEWLRHLPLLSPGTPVRDYAGRELSGSTAAALAVIDLDVGARDLQQCMDTIMRLRGEYLWWRNQAHRVRFRYAGGRFFGYADWAAGIRPHQKAGRFVYEKTAGPSSGRRSFERYLTFMFAMTGTMHNVTEPNVPFADMAAGDFFIQPPPAPRALGHAVVILDLARNPRGEVRALLGEGYTPAQDLHVLKAPGGGAWYPLRPGQDVKTPQWPAFSLAELRRFTH